MKRHKLLQCNLLIILIIILGYCGVMYMDTRAYQSLAEKHVAGIVSLAQLDISKDIESTINKPIVVAQTMAGDEFLKTWIAGEETHHEDGDYLDQLYGYLTAYQRENQYDAVFFVSAKTENYYYYGGLNKNLSKTDSHDVWYYNFLSSGKPYDLQVDTDQTNGNDITVFVNCRVEDTDGTLLGVIGVGLRLSYLEELVRSYEETYNLSVFLINMGGSDNSFHQNTELFVSEDTLPQCLGIPQFSQPITDGHTHCQWYSVDGERRCVITKYDSQLQWNLVMEKNTESLYAVFSRQLRENILVLLASLAACVTLTTVVFQRYNRLLIRTENIDELTGLPNRRLFQMEFGKQRKKRKLPKTLFLMDVDHFKNINDTHGHLFGNSVLAFLGQELRQTVGEHGVAARWGGDEFIGVLDLSGDAAEALFDELMARLNHRRAEMLYPVSISVGMIALGETEALDAAVSRADAALYRAKDGGRNQIVRE